MPSLRLQSLSFLGLLLLAATSLAHATSFSSVVVYGDSLSDNGNLYALTGYPPPPYVGGRRSDGPLAVEQLATQIGAPLHDFAFIGATSGIGNYADNGTQTTPGGLGLPGMEAELASPASQALLASPLVSSSLFVVWGGANDFLVAGSPSAAASNIDFIVASLLSAGATNILVPGMPDLGLTPDFYGDPTATAYSQQFNTLLQASLPTGATYFDTFDLLHQIDADPLAYGFTDVTDPCFDGLTVCANPSQYLFFDGFHPTTAANAILARDFAAAIVPTPEPSSVLLTTTGLAGILFFSYRRRRQTASAN